MVNKITKPRLKTFIAYNTVKMIIVTLIACIILVLIFNGVGKHPTDGQDFKLIIDGSIVVGEDIIGLFDDLKNNDEQDGGFSYEMLKGEPLILRESDEYPISYNLNSIYVPLSYDDVCVLTEKVYKDYVTSGNAKRIDLYITEALAFCNQFLVGGEIDANKVYEYFELTRGKDSRFITKDQKEQGKKDELKRIKAIYKNATTLENCFAIHPELLHNCSFKSEVLNQTFEGPYAINVSNLKGHSENKIENLFQINKTVNDTETVLTTEGIYVVIGDTYDKTGDLFYEQLAFLVTLLRNYTNYLG